MSYPIADIGCFCIQTEQRDPRLFPDRPFKYIDISSIDKRSKQIVSTQEILGKDAPSRARKEVRYNDVLVSTVRPNLNAVARVPEELDGQIASTGFCVLRPKANTLDSHYLFYRTMTRDFVEYLKTRVRGAHYPAVTDSIVRDAPIPLAPPSEQRRIVQILDQAHVLHNNGADADNKIAHILSALFLKTFGSPATNPMGWDIVPISKFVERFEGGRSIAAKTQEGDSGRYRVLKVSAVTWGKYAPNESKPVPTDYLPPKSHFVHAGDLLFSRANTTELVGAVAYVHETPSNLLLPDKIWRFVWHNPEEIDPLFVYSLFRHPAVRYELGKRATGTSGSMQNISMGKVLAMEVPLPPPELQKQFGDFALRLEGIGFHRHRSTEVISKLFQRLLHDAFSGELTAKWREAHMKELLAEMEAQKKEFNTISETALSI